jgi:hypothetical protein
MIRGQGEEEKEEGATKVPGPWTLWTSLAKMRKVTVGVEREGEEGARRRSAVVKEERPRKATSTAGLNYPTSASGLVQLETIYLITMTDS